MRVRAVGFELRLWTIMSGMSGGMTRMRGFLLLVVSFPCLSIIAMIFVILLVMGFVMRWRLLLQLRYIASATEVTLRRVRVMGSIRGLLSRGGRLLMMV